MRAVVDTNVLVSSTIRPDGPVGAVVTRLRRGDFRLVYTSTLIAELTRVLDSPRLRRHYWISDDDAATVRITIQQFGEPVVPLRSIRACRDPDDDAVLEAAIAGKADCIVTGDRDLLELSPFEGIPILTPRAFLELLSAESAGAE